MSFCYPSYRSSLEASLVTMAQPLTKETDGLTSCALSTYTLTPFTFPQYMICNRPGKENNRWFLHFGNELTLFHTSVLIHEATKIQDHHDPVAMMSKPANKCMA